MIPASKKFPHLTFYLGIIFLLLLAANLATGIYYSLVWPLSNDAGIMQYIAWRMLHGAVPYRDFFEADMPGTYLIHMFCISVFGGSDVALRWFDLFCCALAGAGYLMLGGKEKRLYACAAALLFTLLHIAFGPGDLVERDFLMVPFLLFATQALRVFLNAPTRFTPLFIFGLITGYAFWIKPMIAIFVAFSALVLIVKLPSNPQRIKALALIAAGMLVPTIGFLTWLYVMGALPALYDLLVHFLPTLEKLETVKRNQCFLFIFKCCVFLYGPAMYTYGYAGTRIASTDKTLLVLGMAYGLVHFFGQGKLFLYHGYPLYAFTMLYLVWVVPALKGRLLEKIILHAPLLATIYFLDLSQSRIESYDMHIPDVKSVLFTQMKTDTDAALQSVPAAIREPFLLKTPQYAVDFHSIALGQLWSAAYRYHWVAASRHIYPYPMLDTFHSAYVDGLGKELLHDLSTVKPLVIIISAVVWPYPDTLLYETIDTHEPWKTFFRENYRLTKETKKYRVYARIK